MKHHPEKRPAAAGTEDIINLQSIEETHGALGEGHDFLLLRRTMCCSEAFLFAARGGWMELELDEGWIGPERVREREMARQRRNAAKRKLLDHSSPWERECIPRWFSIHSSFHDCHGLIPRKFECTHTLSWSRDDFPIVPFPP